MPSSEEVVLQKMEVERARLQKELLSLGTAIPPKVACADLIRYVENAPEPLAGDGRDANPWTRAKYQNDSCCEIQ
jgi:hypothetical protein